MILTKLASIGDLKVISRTSTEKYKSHPDDLKAVGQQLGVATILECEQLATDLQAELSRKPESLRLLQQLSWVELGRGRKAEAIHAAEHAVNLLPMEKDTYSARAS